MGSIVLPAPAAPSFMINHPPSSSSSSASPTAIRARDWQRLSQSLVYSPDRLEDTHHLGLSQMSQSSTDSVVDFPIPRALLRPDNLGPLPCATSGSQTAKAREIVRTDASLRRRMQAGAALTKLHPQSTDYPTDYARPASLGKQKETSLARHHSDSQLPLEGVILPTHILALRIGPQDPRWTYIPIHWQTLAAFCNRPPSSLFNSAANNVPPNTVPLVEGTMPFPQGFQVLRDYFYTRSLASLLSTLLPADLEKVQTPSAPPPQYCGASQACTKQRRRSAPEALESLARAIASSYTPQEIVSRTKWIYGVYLNAWCLLVNDSDVWTALAMTWSVIVRALDLRLDTCPGCCR